MHYNIISGRSTSELSKQISSRGSNHDLYRRAEVIVYHSGSPPEVWGSRVFCSNSYSCSCLMKPLYLSRCWHLAESAYRSIIVIEVITIMVIMVIIRWGLDIKIPPEQPPTPPHTHPHPTHPLPPSPCLPLLSLNESTISSSSAPPATRASSPPSSFSLALPPRSSGPSPAVRRDASTCWPPTTTRAFPTVCLSVCARCCGYRDDGD